MIKLSQKQQKIIHIFLEKGRMRSSEAHAEMKAKGYDVSLVTIKRDLSKMAENGALSIEGAGRSRAYSISAQARLFAEQDARAYCAIEPDKRYGLDKYNFDLLSAIQNDIFNGDEASALDQATNEYRERTKDLPSAIQKKELERFIIELSWKSSKIEGNTYTLLDTEKLILENKQAPGKTKREARMILNHKDAFNYIRDHSGQFKTITKKNLQDLHAILVKDLRVGLGFRKKPVGIIGSKYNPLDNEYQIAEAVGQLCAAVSRMNSSFSKALLALVGIGYIQPFEDGNKRCARLMANALLMARDRAPLSYRGADEQEYREAMLVFYELNSLMPFKKIFISQYVFAAKNYAANKP